MQADAVSTEGGEVLGTVSANESEAVGVHGGLGSCPLVWQDVETMTAGTVLGESLGSASFESRLLAVFSSTFFGKGAVGSLNWWKIV